MRGTIVFGLLLVMLVAFGGALIVRPRETHDAPAPPAASAGLSGAMAPAAPSSGKDASASASAGAIASAGASVALAADGGASGAKDAGDAVDAGPLRLMERPIRVVAVGWELAAPGLLINGGLTPSPSSEVAAAGLSMSLAAVNSMEAVEVAMARGGADKDGADIAIVPMPSFVSSYEKLRALSPEVFFVVGWSRGREAIVASRDALPSSPVKGEVRMAASAGDAASFLGLFVLDVAGVPPSEVRLLPQGTRADEAPLATIDRGAADLSASERRNLLITTADTPRLVPFVAVAQRGMLEQNGRALTAWARVWLEGTRKLAEDAPAGARQVAAVQGAPDPLALLKRLGQMAPATLGDNVRIAGLSGRGALTLDVLFQRMWYLWRGAGILATPAPESAPISSAVIAAIARSSPALVEPPIARAPGPESGTAGSKQANAAVAKAKVILAHKQPDGKLDEDALIAAAGLLAAVFERSPIQIAVHQAGAVDAARTKRIIERVQERFDIPAGRLMPARTARGSGSAAIEILAVP